MKFYVFDIKSILSLTNKTEDKKLKNILFPFMASAYSNLVLFDKAAFAKDNWSADHSYKKYKEGSFYLEELFFVFEELNERYLNKYLVKFNKFKEDIANLDIFNNHEEYNKFYSNIDRHLMSDLLIGSYKVVEDFDDKLKEAQNQGIVNPIEYILAKENEFKDDIDPRLPYINDLGGLVTETPTRLEELTKESNCTNNTTNIADVGSNFIYTSGLFEPVKDKDDYDLLGKPLYKSEGDGPSITIINEVKAKSND